MNQILIIFQNVCVCIFQCIYRVITQQSLLHYIKAVAISTAIKHQSKPVKFPENVYLKVNLTCTYANKHEEQPAAEGFAGRNFQRIVQYTDYKQLRIYFFCLGQLLIYTSLPIFSNVFQEFQAIMKHIIQNILIIMKQITKQSQSIIV